MSASIKMQTRPTLGQLKQRWDENGIKLHQASQACKAANYAGDAWNAFVEADNECHRSWVEYFQRKEELRAFDPDPREVDYIISEAASNGVCLTTLEAKDVLFTAPIERDIKREIGPWAIDEAEEYRNGQADSFDEVYDPIGWDAEDPAVLADAEQSDAASYGERG